MTRPRTLLEMAGAPGTPATLNDAVLIVIDAQREYLDGALPLDAVEAAVASIAGLLERARRAGAPVIHVAHKGRPGGLFDRQGEGGRFLDEVVPAPGETVVEKALPNAFAGTGLKERIDAAGRSRLILTGFMTHMCVSATARAALDLGYQSTIVSDAVATRALPDPLTGGVLSAEAINRAALAALADRFAVIAPARAIEP